MAGPPERLTTDAPHAVVAGHSTTPGTTLREQLAIKFDNQQLDLAKDAEFDRRLPFAERLSSVNPSLMERIAVLFGVTIQVRGDRLKRTINTGVKNQSIQFFSSLGNEDVPHANIVIVPSIVDGSQIQVDFEDSAVVLGKSSVSFVQRSKPPFVDNPGDYMAITLTPTGSHAAKGNEQLLLETLERFPEEQLNVAKAIVVLDNQPDS